MKLRRFLSTLLVLALVFSLMPAVFAAAETGKTEVISGSTAACGDDWSWTGDGDKIAALPTGEINVDQIFVAAVCTPYWVDNRYTTEATEVPVTFATGEGLVTIALRNRQEDVIWGGAECVFAEITPTAAGEAITKATTVSGTFQMFYAPWGVNCAVPFEVVLNPVNTEGGEDNEDSGDTLPEYTHTISDTTDYANFGGSSWEVEPMTVETTIGPREMFSVALASSYWANPEYTGYGADLTKLNATFANGEGLLDFYVNITAGPIWGGAECEMLTIVPTDAAYALTSDITVTGTIDIYWRGWVKMPFSVTIDVPADAEGGEGDEGGDALPEYTETVSDTTDYANFGGSNWEVEPMTVEAMIGPREKFSVALATSYWANPSVSGYSAEPTQLNATFTNGEGLLDFYVTIAAGPIWGGAECEMLTIVPTDAAYALTADTTVTGTISIYWRGFCEMPFSVTIDVPETEAPCQHENTTTTTVEATCAAEGSVTETCDDCGEVIATETIPVTGIHTYGIVTTNKTTSVCEVCGGGKVFGIYSMSMSLASDLRIKINVTDSTIPADYYAVVKLYSDAGDLQSETRLEPSKLSATAGSFTYDGIKARNMTDKIVFTVYNAEGKQISVNYCRTVEDYILTLYNGASATAEAKTVYVDLLNYGAAAQKHFDYMTDALANRKLTEEMQAYATADAAAPMVNENSKSGVVGGTSVQVKDKIYTTFLFANSSLTSKNAAKVEVTYTKNNADKTVVSKEIAVADLEVNNASSKKLVVDDAAIADCSNPISVTVYDADGNVVGTATDCVYYYASRQASDDNGIFAALRKLITSAGVYFGA